MKKKQDIYFIGKISSVINQIAIINYWSLNIATNRLSTYHRCYQNNPKLNKEKCTIQVNTQQLYKLTVDSKKFLRAYTEDILHNNPIYNSRTLGNNNIKRIPKEQKILETLIDNREITTYLWNVKQSLNIHKSLTVQFITTQHAIHNIQSEVVVYKIHSLENQLLIKTLSWSSTTKNLIIALIYTSLIVAPKTKIQISTNRIYF